MIPLDANLNGSGLVPIAKVRQLALGFGLRCPTPTTTHEEPE